MPIKKNVKGKVTDQKIIEIVKDIYMSDPLYMIIYREITKFFDPNNGLGSDAHDRNRWTTIKEDGTIETDGPLDSFQDLFTYSMNINGRDLDVYQGLYNRPIKAKDIEKKYGISNVTIKSRLEPYFYFRRVQEGKVGYLGLGLRHEEMIGVAMHSYFNSEEGKRQTGIIRTFSLLQNS